MATAVVLVLDSLGIGSSADATEFFNGEISDNGANTLLHIARACAAGACEQARSGALHIPNLQKLGLQKACELSSGCVLPLSGSNTETTAAWGYAVSASSGKDTISGHWEMMGYPVTFDWGYFTQPQHSFPAELINEFIHSAKIPGILGNCHGSGTEMIQRYGQLHLLSGQPICYTSADSVFQIACHQAVYSQAELEQMCLVARQLMDQYQIARVIARPFEGSSAQGFRRIAGRRDYTVPPAQPTLLDRLQQRGDEIISVGKIKDIFANRGITTSLPAEGLDLLFDTTLEAVAMARSGQQNTLVFTNFVDFDSGYGHRRDISGYAAALEAFDRRLPELLRVLEPEDILIISADHGCDPSWPGTDHTREHVPVLCHYPLMASRCLGRRDSFADIGQSLAAFFHLPSLAHGQSFLSI